MDIVLPKAPDTVVALGWFAFSTLLIAGFSLAACVTHFLDWLYYKRDRDSLAFCALCLTVAAHAVTLVFLYRSDSVNAYALALKVDLCVLFLSQTALVWFVTLHMRVRTRLSGLAITAYFGVLFVANALSAHSLLTTQVRSLIVLALRGGERFVTADFDLSPWAAWCLAGTLITYAYCLIVCFQGRRNVERGEALAMGVSLAGLLGTWILRIVIESNASAFVVLSHYAFLGFIFLMGCALSARYGRQTVSLATTHEALRESEERFRILVEQAPDAIVLYDLDLDRFVDANPNAERLFGCSKQELLASRLHRFYLPEDAANQPATDARAYSEPVQAGQDIVFERAIRSASGKDSYCEIRVVRFPAAGRRLVRASLVDITERKRVEEALRASELKYRIVADNTQDWEFWMGTDGAFVYVSPSCERTTGYSASAFMADPELVERIVHSDDREMWRLHRAGVESGKAAAEMEFRIIRADGTVRWINHVCQPVFDASGTYLGVRGANRDVTARHEAEERARVQREQALQVNKLAALGTLVAGVAHEINNPNHVILSAVTTINHVWTDVQRLVEDCGVEHDLAVGALDWEHVCVNMPEMLASVKRSSERIRDIVQDLRAYARPETAATIEEIDLGDVAAAASSWLEHLIQKTTHRFELNRETGIPHVRGMRRRLEQAVVNLVMNACQALPSPECAVRLSVYYDRTSYSVVLMVEDEGIGMTQETLGQIVDPFFTTKRDSGGTGLGLSIVFGIVNEHSGTLSFESEPGKGTTARVALPVLN